MNWKKFLFLILFLSFNIQTAFSQETVIRKKSDIIKLVIDPGGKVVKLRNSYIFIPDRYQYDAKIDFESVFVFLHNKKEIKPFLEKVKSYANAKALFLILPYSQKDYFTVSDMGVLKTLINKVFKIFPQISRKYSFFIGVGIGSFTALKLVESYNFEVKNISLCAFYLDKFKKLFFGLHLMKTKNLKVHILNSKYGKKLNNDELMHLKEYFSKYRVQVTYDVVDFKYDMYDALFIKSLDCCELGM